MSDELKKMIIANNQTLDEFLNNIAEWNKIVPAVQRAKQEYQWVINSMQQAPDLTTYHVDEEITNQLYVTQTTLSGLLNVPPPQQNTWNIVTTSGTVPASLYYRYVRSVQDAVPSNIQVIQWAETSSQEYQKIRDEQHRSALVNQRLNQLSAKLATLHNSATEKALVATAGTASPVEAAATQRELLDQFKGDLVNRCKAGKGVKFSRIAENLAIDSPVTKLAIENSQSVYDAIHEELSEIAKSRRNVSGERLTDLLRQVEDHIWSITNAIDSTKIGFEFAT